MLTDSETSMTPEDCAAEISDTEAVCVPDSRDEPEDAGAGVVDSGSWLRVEGSELVLAGFPKVMLFVTTLVKLRQSQYKP